jgi:hypothetical protein
VGADDDARTRPVRFGGPPDIYPVAEAARRFFGGRFAGDWFALDGRRRRYVVAAVGLRDDEAEAFRQDVNGRSRWLRLVDARYSEQDLERFYDAVINVLSGNTSKDWGLDLEVENNRIKVALEPEDIERFRTEIEAVVPGNALQIGVSHLKYGI